MDKVLEYYLYGEEDRGDFIFSEVCNLPDLESQLIEALSCPLHWNTVDRIAILAELKNLIEVIRTLKPLLSHHDIPNSTVRTILRAMSSAKTESLGFWQKQWIVATPELIPIVFSGLRRTDVQAAIDKLPNLLDIARACGKDPQIVIRLLVSQAPNEVLHWLATSTYPVKDKVREVYEEMYDK